MKLKMQGLVFGLLISANGVQAMSWQQKSACVSIVSALTGTAGYGLSKKDKGEAAGHAATMGAALGSWGCGKLSRVMQIAQADDNVWEAERMLGDVRFYCLPTEVVFPSQEIAEVAQSRWPLAEGVQVLVRCKERSIAAKALIYAAQEKNPALVRDAHRADELLARASEYNAQFDAAIEKARGHADYRRQHSEYDKFLRFMERKQWLQDTSAK